MKSLTSHFIIYLSTILLLVVGTTNYWLYHNNTEQLKASFDSRAHNQLVDLSGLSGYYISYYEFELLKKLTEDTVASKDILHISIKSIDGDINLEAGLPGSINTRQYTKKIINDNEFLGTVKLALDDSLLRQELQQALINSVLLALITVSLIGSLIFLFFRSRIMETVNLAHSEKELAHKEKEFFSLIMDSASSLVIVLDESGLIVLANSTCESYCTDNTMPIEKRSLWDCFSITCNEIPLQDLLNTKNIDHLMENTCISICEKNNEKAIIQWSFNALKGDTPLLIATGVNETEQYLESEKLSYLAMHDPLTGLPNRSLFMDRLEITLAHYNRDDEAFCILYLDLDGFKPINDSHGHEAGDFILKAIAVLLQENLRAVDTAARLGGDEFGIILTNIKNRENAALVAQKCITAITQPFQFLTHEINLGISIGIVFYPDHKDDLDKLINYADTAMYKAKKAGGNTFCFYE